MKINVIQNKKVYSYNCSNDISILLQKIQMINITEQLTEY